MSGGREVRVVNLLLLSSPLLFSPLPTYPKAILENPSYLGRGRYVTHSLCV